MYQTNKEKPFFRQTNSFARLTKFDVRQIKGIV